MAKLDDERSQLNPSIDTGTSTRLYTFLARVNTAATSPKNEREKPGAKQAIKLQGSPKRDCFEFTRAGWVKFDTWAISAAPSWTCVFGSSSKKNAKHTCKTDKQNKKTEQTHD